MTDDRALLERAARSERSRRDNELTAVRSECERLKVELAICREAIEVCYDVADNLPSDDDGDAAVRRTTLRRLNEAIGKAAPRLLMERREGQKMYGLHYRELHAEVERLRKDAERSVGKTAARCREMAMWPQGIDDEQAYYGSMFAEFITKEFGAAIDAAMRQEGGG